MANDKENPALSKAFEALQEGKTLTSRQRQLLTNAAEAAIDNFMRSVGIVNPAEFTDEHGIRHLKLGSAEGVAFIDEVEGDLYLHVEAFVMKVPADQELIVPLYRELLELNLDIPGTCRFAIRDDAVVVVATEDLGVLRDDSDFARHIHWVMTYTDAMDSDLAKKYDRTTRKRPAKRR